MTSTTPIVSFFVRGVPKPGGSKSGSNIFRRDGSLVLNAKGNPIVRLRDAGGISTKNWKELVGVAGRGAWGKPPLETALAVYYHFIMERPVKHYGRGRMSNKVKWNAPQLHVFRPDVLKLTRSTEDALTGIIWKDDNQTSVVCASKSYGETPGVLIDVYELDDRRYIKRIAVEQ